MKYERLTEWISGVPAIKTYTGSYMTPFDSDVYDAIKRLAELEDKIEQGTLIELPCKVGDTVYVDRDTWKNQYIVHFTFINYKAFYYGEIVSFVKTKKQFLMKVRVYKSSSRLSYETARYPISAIGKTVFLTREEAEKRLKELQE